MTTETLPEKKYVQPVIPIVEGKGLMPKDFDGLWRVSQIMAASGFVPKEMGGKPESVFVACQMGLEVGLSLMASVQNIAVINGRPSMWGDAVLALVRSSGKLNKFSEEFTGVFPNDDFKAVCTAQRGSDNIVREFSIIDAKMAGLWKYPDTGATPWHKYPKRMLQMRARSWALRDGFGDILRGIQTTEEIMDMEPQDNGTYAVITETTPSQTEPSPKLDTSKFDKLAMETQDTEHLDEFLKVTAEANETTVDQLKVAGAENFKAFWSSFQAWRSANKVQTPPTRSPELQAKIDEVKAIFNIDADLAKQALAFRGMTDPDELKETVTAGEILKKFDELVAKSDA